ncbi:MAG: hypothetical protein MRY81_15615 [Donghicola eburneus]|jgi:hypothetical protein|nr:hypothetical protein [Donghicola eburneus]MCI5041098.1 hypothetical protein [Donghicola eburneus]
MILQGEFSGRSGHEMTGRFTLRRVRGGYRLITSNDFFFDAAAPAPAWALGDPDQSPYPGLVADSIWHKLEPFSPVSGIQYLRVPDHDCFRAARAVITWCTLTRIPLGEGRVTSATA